MTCLSKDSDQSKILRHCARYWSIAPRVYPRGVFKYRNLEAAQRARQRDSISQKDKTGKM
jgi:hypothetical protein